MVFSISLKKIIQNINVPLLSSIGIHGIFFALVLPQWKSNGDLSSNTQLRNTNVIELNQLEQTRVPNQNLDNSFNWYILYSSLPNEENQTLAFNNPNSSLPEVQIDPFAFPPMNSSGAINNLPAPPPISFSNSNFSNLPLPNYQIDSSAQIQIPPPPNIQEDNSQEIITSLPTIQDSDLPQNLDLPTGNQQITRTIEITPEEEAQIREKLFGNSPIQITANPRDIINSKNGEANINNQNNVTNKPAIVNPLPENHQSLTSQLQKNTENTSDEEARKNYVAWATEVKNVQSKQITLNGQYPKDACIRKLDATTTYGVTVNPQGNVIDTKLIKSSGYNIFNNQALTQIKNYQFPNDTGANQPYHVYVNFNYNNQVCPSVSINNLGDIPPQKPANQNTSSTNNNQQLKNKSDNPPREIISSPQSENESVETSQNNQQETTNSQPKINLPNTPDNKANTLVIPNPSSEVPPSTETVPSSSPSNSNQPQSANSQDNETPLSTEKESEQILIVEPLENQSTPENPQQIQISE